MEHVSAAHTFFQAHKDLFLYDQYYSHQNSYQSEGQADKESYLDHYCKLDRDRPSMPSIFNLRVSMLHIQTRRLPVTNFADTTTVVPLPKVITLQSTASILEPFTTLQTPGRSPLEYGTQHTQPRLAIRVRSNKSAVPQNNHPDCVSAAKFPADRSSFTQQHHSLVRQSIESKPKYLSLPKLNELLIDQETRAAATAHKPWNESRKIQILIGSNCVGPVSAASRKFLPSIQSRLRASANVSERRERLYELLCRDYDELSKRNTQVRAEI